MSRSVLSSFHPVVAEWFSSALGAPTSCQELGWDAIRSGASTLLVAPTGSGKTLAAFLSAVDRLMFGEAASPGCRVLYVSPLKALAVDVERNLQAPVQGIAELARSHGQRVHVPSLQIRTGDTPASQRARMLRRPPELLITTPESLYLLATSQGQRILRDVDTVIIDEIHSLAPSKRGAHLMLTLERIERARGDRSPMQRIGLSATQRPLDEMARFLGGLREGVARPVTIVDTGARKKLELTVEAPDVEMGRLGDTSPIGAEEEGRAGARASIWPHIHSRIVELVRAHRTTLVFVNSRRLAERLAAALNTVAGHEIALAHHGSIAREKRQSIEARLKQGELPALVATSSLELGIDMGSVDLVIQVEAPGSIASGVQRIGRACHGVSGIPRGVLIAKHRGDLLACAAAADCIRRGDIEETHYPRNPLDVLAQQLVATVSDGPVASDEVFSMVRCAAPYATLTRGAFDDVLDMLSGRYPSERLSDLKPRITWDRTSGVLRAREGARKIAVGNGGTIPDRGLYGVFLPGEGGSSTGGMRVGELDEEMVFELRVGEVFLLGASSWRADEITHDRVVVSPAPGRPGKMPFWHGDRPGRSRSFGEAIGRLARKLADDRSDDAHAWLAREQGLSEPALRNLTSYVHEQREATGEVPSDETIVVERYVDESGDWRVCVLTPFGTAVHAPWSMVLRARLEEDYPGTDVTYTDDGMVFRIGACDEPPPVEAFFPASEGIEREVTKVLGGTSLFAARFRECAARALLLPRRSPTRRTPLWAQRRRAGDLLSVASSHPSFPIVLEAYRECLRDVFDLPALASILRSVERRATRVCTVDSVAPSPFSSNVLFTFVANFIYLLDAPLAERKAQSLSIDYGRLRELLGDAEIRELLDPDVIEQWEAQLQGITRPAGSPDALHDLLLRVGELSAAELDVRSSGGSWLEPLLAQSRIAQVEIAKQQRFIASEDAGRYRAIGVAVPAQLPSQFLEAGEAPWRFLAGRYARTHGPFRAEAVAERWGVPLGEVKRTLGEMVQAGTLIEGGFVRGGQGMEYCDAGVLRAIRSKSLARARRQAQPVPPEAYSRFLLHWQGLKRRRRGPDALLQALKQLQGCPLLASALESEILPARIESYAHWELDALCARGELTWTALGPVGSSDARIAIYTSDQEALLAPEPGRAEGEMAQHLRELLASGGAMFFRDIASRLGGYPAQWLDVLWSMVFAGEVTNDTFEPLRSRCGGAVSGRGPAGAEGRWSLRRVPEQRDATAGLIALSRTLLERCGIVTREAAQAESLEGGFSAVAPVLRALEESGGVRRGYFVSGVGGVQYALPGADEQLRSVREETSEDDLLVLSAVDPASAWGAVLPWPAAQNEGGRPQRAAGAWVILQRGRCLGWLGRTGRDLLTFVASSEPERTRDARDVARAVGLLLKRTRRRAWLLATIDGVAAHESPLAGAFRQEGFLPGAKGLMVRARR